MVSGFFYNTPCMYAFFYRLLEVHNQSINNLPLVIILKRETFLTYLVPKVLYFFFYNSTYSRTKTLNTTPEFISTDLIKPIIQSFFHKPTIIATTYITVSPLSQFCSKWFMTYWVNSWKIIFQFQNILLLCFQCFIFNNQFAWTLPKTMDTLFATRFQHSVNFQQN